MKQYLYLYLVIQLFCMHAIHAAWNLVIVKKNFFGYSNAGNFLYKKLRAKNDSQTRYLDLNVAITSSHSVLIMVSVNVFANFSHRSTIASKIKPCYREPIKFSQIIRIPRMQSTHTCMRMQTKTQISNSCRKTFIWSKRKQQNLP